MKGHKARAKTQEARSVRRAAKKLTPMVRLTLDEGRAFRAAVMGDRFDTAHINSAISKVDAVEAALPTGSKE